MVRSLLSIATLLDFEEVLPILTSHPNFSIITQEQLSEVFSSHILSEDGFEVEGQPLTFPIGHVAHIINILRDLEAFRALESSSLLQFLKDINPNRIFSTSDIESLLSIYKLFEERNEQDSISADILLTLFEDRVHEEDLSLILEALQSHPDFTEIEAGLTRDESPSSVWEFDMSLIDELDLDDDSIY